MYNLHIEYYLVNFDSHVWLKEDSVNDLHLYLANVNPKSINSHWFLSTSTSEKNFTVDPFTIGKTSGTIVNWEFDPPIGYCNWVHVGVRFDSTYNVMPLGALWTHSKPKEPDIPPRNMVFEPVFWQNWRTNVDTIIDIVINDVDLEATKGLIEELDPMRVRPRVPVSISRTWAFSAEIIPLEELTWEGKKLAELEWQSEKPVRIEPGGAAELKIAGFDPKEHKTVIVKYSVFDPEIQDTTARYINQAVIIAEKAKR